MSNNPNLQSPAFNDFAERLQSAITAADNAGKSREVKQLNSIMTAVVENQEVTMFNFWSKTSKEFGREWNELRVQPTPEVTPDQEDSTPEPAPPESTQEPTPETPTEKPKRTYRTITIENGKNPFREGSKNYKIFECLQAGGHTREQIVEKSGADDKSVGYIIWLVRRSGFEITRDSSTKRPFAYRAATLRFNYKEESAQTKKLVYFNCQM